MVTRKIFLFILLASVDFIQSQTTQDLSKDPVVVVTLMVKNEEPVIEQTLETYLGNPEVGFFIFDTGSTDNTIAAAELFFKKHNIVNYAIEQEPFIDFAASRNRGLRLAEKAFPNTPFLLMPDAEWYLTGINDLVKFCKAEIKALHHAYLVDIVCGEIDFTTPRLIKAHKNVAFEGVVHEAIPTSGIRAPSAMSFNVGTSKYGVEKSRQRWKRDVQMLSKYLEENPNHSRTLFYLAQTHHCLGDLKNAYKYYEMRTRVSGWDEEDFMALYRFAQVAEQRSRVENNESLWRVALDYYLKAYQFRPCRAEPLVKLAEHYRADNSFSLSYLFAKHASEMPYPATETLFLEKNDYTFSVHDILGIVCWYLGKDDIGEKSVRKAMLARGEMPHLQRNLSLYLERKGTVA